MKISRVIHNGNTRYRVNEAQGQDGKRQRKFFETREAAEQYVKQRTEETRAYGVHFAALPLAERANIGYQLERLKSLGWALAAAVDFIEKHGKAAPSLPLGTVADEFLKSKETGGLRQRYLKTLRASIKRFLLGRRQRLIRDITPGEIQEYISSNGWLPATMRSYLIDVRTLFAFAVKRKYLLENTALAVDLPKVEETPPGIVSPDQTRAILEASHRWRRHTMPCRWKGDSKRALLNRTANWHGGNLLKSPRQGNSRHWRPNEKNPNPMNIESLLSKAAVMERLGVSDKTLRRLVKQGRLVAVKLGKTSPLKFRQLDVARFVESASVTGI